MPSIDLDCINSKSHGNNCNKNNRNGNRVGGQEQESDNLESLESFLAIKITATMIE